MTQGTHTDNVNIVLPCPDHKEDTGKMWTLFCLVLMTQGKHTDNVNIVLSCPDHKEDTQTMWTLFFPVLITSVRFRHRSSEKMDPLFWVNASKESVALFFLIVFCFVLLHCPTVIFSHGKFGSLSPRKASCAYPTLINHWPSVCSIFVLSYHRLWGLLCTTDGYGIFNVRTQCGCVPYSRRRVRHKQVCIRDGTVATQQSTEQDINCLVKWSLDCWIIEDNKCPLSIHTLSSAKRILIMKRNTCVCVSLDFLGKRFSNAWLFWLRKVCVTAHRFEPCTNFIIKKTHTLISRSSKVTMMIDYKGLTPVVGGYTISPVTIHKPSGHSLTSTRSRFKLDRN